GPTPAGASPRSRSWTGRWRRRGRRVDHVDQSAVVEPVDLPYFGAVADDLLSVRGYVAGLGVVRHGDGAVGARLALGEVVREVERGQRGQQEADREHDAQVEQVDQAVERITGAVLVSSGARVDLDHGPTTSGCLFCSVSGSAVSTAATYSRS